MSAPKRSDVFPAPTAVGSGPEPSGFRAADDVLKSAAVLVVDDEPGMRNFLERALKDSALLEVADSVAAGEELRRRYHFDLMVVDIRLPGRSGIEWLQDLRDQGLRTDVIFITAYADLEMAIAALRAGATDFILKPFRMEQMLAAVRRCLERRQILRENFLLRREVDGLHAADGIIGQNAKIQEIAALIGRVAPAASTVLIEGETGTGKELVARAIHRLSGRRGSFAAVNCGSISPDLLESELFGHTKGAFTGAHSARDGLFSYAQNGTLFLDEIAEMPLPMQAKLLRVLEERTVRPVGSDREVPVDCRVIAATNRQLDKLVSEGRFRQDLYYRLNVLTITVPPLRERLDDIPILASHFSETLAAELGVPPIPFSHSDIVQLQSRDWPGNVRELKNLIERSLLLGQLPADGWQSTVAEDPDRHTEGVATAFPLGWTLAEVEKNYMLRVLDSVEGNKSEAARRLGISRKTMERKLHAWRDELRSNE